MTSVNTSEQSRLAVASTKPPTIQDVADALNMHKSTISIALSGKGALSADTRRRILTTVRQMGYVPNPVAQRLANGYRNPAVCIISGHLDMGLGAEKILLIQRELSKESVEVPIYVCPEPMGDGTQHHAAQVRQICRQRPRGIICAPHSLDESVFLELKAYQDMGGFVVSYDLEIPLECDQVIFDREHNAYIAARKLLDAGHRRIGFAFASKIDWLPGAPHYMQPGRTRGFMRALHEYGVTLNDEWMYQHATYEKGGEELAHLFLQSKNRPTALAIVNDYVALAFMVTIVQNGVRIPEDLSVVGHDNQPISEYCPVPLTSATQPAEKIVKAVVDLLQARIDGDVGPPRKVIVQGEVIERDSIAFRSDE